MRGLLKLYQDELHIYLEILETGDKIRFDAADNTSQLAVDRVEFSDGVSISSQTLMNIDTVNAVDDWQVL